MEIKAGPDGMVDFYDIPGKRWRRAPTVDVKEMLKIGTASLRVTEEPAPAPVKISKTDEETEELEEIEEGSSPKPTREELSRLLVPELRQKAVDLGVEDAETMNKKALIDAIVSH